MIDVNILEKIAYFHKDFAVISLSKLRKISRQKESFKLTANTCKQAIVQFMVKYGFNIVIFTANASARRTGSAYFRKMYFFRDLQNPLAQILASCKKKSVVYMLVNHRLRRVNIGDHTLGSQESSPHVS